MSYRRRAPEMLTELMAKISGFESAMGEASKRLSAIDRKASRAFAGFDKIGARLIDVGRTLSSKRRATP